MSPLREYLEVLCVIAALTLGGWFAPSGYRAMGYVYLLAIIGLCLRVGRGPVLFAAIASSLAWSVVIIPPQLSFSVYSFEDGLILGTYFVVAIIAGQLTARIRAQELLERQREERATALFHLTRALAGARSLDDAAEAALRQADKLFNARTAMLLLDESGKLASHPASSFELNAHEKAVAEWACRNAREAGRFAAVFSAAEALHIPMVRAAAVQGVFVVAMAPHSTVLSPEQHDLIEGFAAQISLLVEREHLRVAGEREKLRAVSSRLHRTLLDSVSHEIKTPLAVLRSASENLGTEDRAVRGTLVAEIRMATSRLDHLVANLLNQTRLESGSVSPCLDWCDARDIVSAARRDVGDALEGHPLTVEIPEDMPLFMGDAPLLEQVVSNLLLNAAVHTPPGTPVSVSAGAEESTERAFIVVSDRGGGIPPEQRVNLFHKFQRGNARRTGGLGLGLSIVRGFMLAHGGDVVVGDTPGGGARFTIHLPLAAHSGVPVE